MVDTATAAEERLPTRIVLTHPPTGGPARSNDSRAGLPARWRSRRRDRRYEPVAAARHYLREHHLDVGSTVAIFDFGGGTFDAALLRRTADGFEAVGEARGLEQLGGIDLDESILHRLMSAAVDLGSLDDTPSNWAAVDRLRHECVAAKEVLSDDTVAVIPVMLPEVHTEVRLTRTEFESMIGPAIGDAVNLIEATIRDAGLEPSGVAAVLLVGGTSRIPLVNQLVAAQLQVPVLSDVHPKHAVAMGSVTAPVGGLLDRTLGPVSSSWPQPLAGGVEASASVAPTAEPDPTPVEAVAVTPAASGQYTPVGSGTGGVEQTSGGEAVVQPKGRWIFAAVVTALAIVGGLILLNRGSDPTDPGDSAATSPAVSSTIGDETTSSAPETTTLPETTTTEPTTTSTTGAPSPPSDGSGMLEWIGVDEIGQIGSPVSSSDGWFATPGPASLPTVAWETDIVGRAGTAAGGGMVFAMVPSGERAYELVAFDAASGARLWSDQPTGTCCTNLVLTDRTVATVTTDRGPELRFLERSSGALIDALPIDDLFTNLPADAAFTEFELAQSVVPHRLAIERGAAFVVGSTTGDGSFVAAIDLGTGTTRWSHYDPTTSVVPSVFLDASVVLVADTDSVTTLDIATGDVLWTTDALNRDRIEHLDAGVVLSIDEGYEANTGFDARSGVEVWAVQQRWCPTSPVTASSSSN
ncbi:MAG: Hsp70 family protein [Acidimicrobiales bacterium]